MTCVFNVLVMTFLQCLPQIAIDAATATAVTIVGALSFPALVLDKKKQLKKEVGGT